MSNVRDRLKTIAKILAAVFLSIAMAFVWWAYFPEPPSLPDRFLRVFEPIVMFIADRNVHGAEELLSFLEVWCYVAVLFLFAVAGSWVIRRITSVYSLAQCQTLEVLELPSTNDSRNLGLAFGGIVLLVTSSIFGLFGLFSIFFSLAYFVFGYWGWHGLGNAVGTLIFGIILFPLGIFGFKSGLRLMRKSNAP